MRNTARFLIALCALTLPGVGFAQPAATEEAAPSDIRHFTVAAASSEIRVDGVLDEPAWADAVVIDMPFEWYPGDNVRPPVETECLVTYGDGKLYVAFRAYDPEPAKIRAHLMDRDSVGSFVQDDHVGFQLDPFNDERQALQFRVNPLGVQVDGTFDEYEGAEDFSWDAIWDSAGRITDDGYVVELAVPFQQLRFPRTLEVQTWGFEGFRNYPRTDRHRITSKFTDRGKDCTLCQENKVSGFQGLKPGLNLEVVPTVTTVRTDTIDSFPDGNLVSGDEDVEAGVDVRWGFTTNLALNATVNPDFSQVEADTAQLDVNTRFALFFPEKRPFFLEGADYFETPLRAVFTRTVADPSWGVKITGKEGRNTIAAYVADDDQTNLILPGNQGSRLGFIDGSVTSSVLRYRRDIGARSTLGVLYTGREGDDYHNRVAGVDSFVRLNPSNSMRLQYLRSDTLYPEALANAWDQSFDSFNGDALHLGFLHISRNWVGTAQYQDIDPEFRADSGFIPRVDLRSTEAMIERRFWGEEGDWYRVTSVGARGERVKDQDGIQTDEQYEIFGILQGSLQSHVELTLTTRDEYYLGQTFELDYQTLFGQFKPTGSVRLVGQVRIGDGIDLVNARLADQTVFQAVAQLRLGQHLDWTFIHDMQTLDVEGGELFQANLSQTVIVYQFNVRTFVRAVFQYTDITRQTERYLVPVEPKSEDLFTQLLFSYKINPRTVLFAGYTDARVGAQGIDLTQTDRTFFLKLGYAFLF